MKSKLPALSWAIALTVALIAADALAAKPTKPGGGGGTTPVPPGTIYFWQSTADPYIYAEMEMAGDGSGKTQIGPNGQGDQFEPSHQLHGGERWFLKALDTDTVNPYGYAKQELFALTESGAAVQLTDDPDVGAHNFRWAKDDSFLSYEAINWVTGEQAILAAAIDWSSGMPAIGIPQIVLETGYYSSDPEVPTIGVYDWSPAGDEIVYNDVSNQDSQEIKVIRYFADGTSQTRHLDYGFNPAWSPDGGRIAYTRYDGAIWTIRPDGTDALQITKATFDRNQWDPHWSPDSMYIAYTESVRKQKGFQQPTYTNDVHRVTASGGNITSLTADTAEDCFVGAWR